MAGEHGDDPGDTPGDWFALVDTAQDPALIGLVQQCPWHHCLISGVLDPELAAALPYLVQLTEGDALTTAWNAGGAGQNWGILLQSSAPIERLRRHFKKFLHAMLPDGTVALFRFYDPRVFRTYIRAATAEERAPWFSDVARYWVEGATPGQTNDFRFEHGQLFDADVRVDA